jgi:hypothetical protein
MFIGFAWFKYLIYWYSFKHGQANDLQYIMKTVGQVKAFFDNDDQHVCADRNLDLRLDRLFVAAIRRLDSKLMLYPFERSVINPGLKSKLLVKNVERLPMSPLTTTRRSVAG